MYCYNLACICKHYRKNFNSIFAICAKILSSHESRNAFRTTSLSLRANSLRLLSRGINSDDYRLPRQCLNLEISREIPHYSAFNRNSHRDCTTLSQQLFRKGITLRETSFFHHQRMAEKYLKNFFHYRLKTEFFAVFDVHLRVKNVLCKTRSNDGKEKQIAFESTPEPSLRDEKKRASTLRNAGFFYRFALAIQ